MDKKSLQDYGKVVEGKTCQWCGEELPISMRPAERLMRFARDCDGQDRLLLKSRSVRLDPNQPRYIFRKGNYQFAIR
jgi:hypothetical protein